MESLNKRSSNNAPKGIVFNIQRYSIQDGPGIRTTVFLKGCPLRCQWCSNPESQQTFPEVAHSDMLCTQCGECIKVCPVQAISLAEKGIRIDRKLCNNCGECVAVCYPGALKVFGKEMTITEVLAEVKRDVAYYNNSDGGITVSGGDPLAQASFVVPFLEQCYNLALHTTIDTCGHVRPEVLEKILHHADLVLYDLKHMEADTHIRLTGVSNDLILSNMKLVAQSGIGVIARVPIIPGINDSTENIIATASFVAGLKTVTEINLLPYHRFGVGKYGMLDRPYLLGNISSTDKSHLEKIKELITTFGLDCKIEE